MLRVRRLHCRASRTVAPGDRRHGDGEILYENSGNSDYTVLNWDRHQVVNRPSTFRHPTPTALSDGSVSPQVALRAESKGKGEGERERKGRTVTTNGNGEGETTSDLNDDCRHRPVLARNMEQTHGTTRASTGKGSTRSLKVESMPVGKTMTVQGGVGKTIFTPAFANIRVSPPGQRSRAGLRLCSGRNARIHDQLVPGGRCRISAWCASEEKGIRVRTKTPITVISAGASSRNAPF